MHRYYVYIMSSYKRILYIGVTSFLQRRVYEHKTRILPGFTSDYRIDRLVYFEEYGNVYEAIACEKQLKRWSRSKKLALIEAINPQWNDLTLEM